MTVENDCKFGETEPQRGVFQLQNCAATANFGIKNGMAHRLHNLVS